MFNRIFDGEQVCQHLLAGQRREGQGPYELLRGMRDDGLNSMAAFHEQTGQLRRLVSRDAASNAQKDFHAGLRESARVPVLPEPGRRGYISPGRGALLPLQLQWAF